LSALHALGGCASVFFRREDRLAPFLSAFCPGPSLSSHAGTARTVAAACRALERGGDVGLATLGHPLFAGAVGPKELARLARRAGSVEVVGSCSALGAALAELQTSVDVASRGLRVYDWRAAAGRLSGDALGALLVVFPDGAPDARGRRALSKTLRRAYGSAVRGRLLGAAAASSSDLENLLRRAGRSSPLYAPA
jgi:hypothetical protein